MAHARRRDIRRSLPSGREIRGRAGAYRGLERRLADGLPVRVLFAGPGDFDLLPGVARRVVFLAGAVTGNTWRSSSSQSRCDIARGTG